VDSYYREQGRGTSRTRKLILHAQKVKTCVEKKSEVGAGSQLRRASLSGSVLTREGGVEELKEKEGIWNFQKGEVNSELLRNKTVYSRRIKGKKGVARKKKSNLIRIKVPKKGFDREGERKPIAGLMEMPSDFKIRMRLSHIHRIGGVSLPKSCRTQTRSTGGILIVLGHL